MPSSAPRSAGRCASAWAFMPGPLLLGRIGYGEAVDLTVVGNAVNVASRLEALAKEKGFQIVMSAEVARMPAAWTMRVRR